MEFFEVNLEFTEYIRGTKTHFKKEIGPKTKYWYVSDKRVNLFHHHFATLEEKSEKVLISTSY